MPKSRYYITTAIDYPNAKPHIGHAYEKIIADFYARWHRQSGADVFFLTGTDEHGQKIEKTAKEQGKKPQQFVDEMSEHFKALCKVLNITNTNFIRTTDKKHVKTALELFKKVNDKGLIYKATYTGLYCYGCEAFYTEKDLENGNCPTHKRPAEKLSEENYFFKLSTFQQQIIDHINQHPDFIQPESRRNEILNRLKEPLADLSVTRTTITWGIPVPFDKKHVLYVWFDALLNYLSGVAYPTTKYQKYWPAQLQLIGKDITWFHTVIWPAILLASDLPLPKTVYAHGWLTVDGQKMSKSLGNVIDPIAVVDKFGADQVRYFLLKDVPAGEDGDFSEKSLIEKINTDLADALGNLLQRTSVLVHKYYKGTIPICGKLTDKEKALNDSIPDISKLTELVNSYKWHHAIEHIWTYIYRCNKYVAETEPWKLGGDAERLSTVLYTLIEHLRIISILVYPITPASAEKITAQIGQPLSTFKKAKFTTKTKGTLSQPEILFRKIEQGKVVAGARMPDEDPFGKLNLKVAKILSVENHPNADKLYVLKLDAGEPRQLVAGVKAHYSPEELIGRHVIIISNLKPAQLRGVESQGMMLAAEKDGIVKVLELHNSKPGDQVYMEGITPKTSQITIDDFKSIVLTTEGGHVVYNKKELKTNHEHVHVHLPDGATIR